MKKELQSFLTSRRSRVQPEEVGLPRGMRRRVAGLRREEVASLAGVSLDYYVQIERGRAPGVSDEVLSAIASALKLKDLERDHLFNLARGHLRSRPSHAAPLEVPETLQLLLDSMVKVPAVLLSGTLDILASNAMGRAFYWDIFTSQEPSNLASYVYCTKKSRLFYDDWESIADDVAAILRTEITRSPDSRAFSLIDNLTKQSEDFARRWETHNLTSHQRGLKVVRHPKVGEIRMRYEALEVPSLPGAKIFGYIPVADHSQTTLAIEKLEKLSE